MKEQFKPIEDALAYLFEVQPQQSGSYINPVVEELRKALNDCKKDPTQALAKLKRAIDSALPAIECYIDPYLLKQKVNELAIQRGTYILWENYFSSNRYTHFTYGLVKKPDKNNFMAWLSFKLGEDFTEIDEETQVEIMIKKQKEQSFMVKLMDYLEKHPEFLLKLILKSPRLFTKVLKTKLAFQLEDRYLAQAIVHHGYAILESHDEGLNKKEKIQTYVNNLNALLSLTGRSLNKLLVNQYIRLELEKSEIFKIIMRNDLLSPFSVKTNHP